MRKLRIVGKWQRSSRYKKSIIIFSILCFLLFLFVVTYVNRSMVIYERNLVDNYIKYLAENGKLTKNINDNLFEISSYEISNAKITDGVNKLYKSDNLNIKKNTKLSVDGIFAYDLYNNNKLISTVSLKSTKTYKRMAILTIDEWEIVDSKNYFEDGIYSYEISVPKNYKVYINNKELTNDFITSESDVTGLENLTKYIEINKKNNYKINNLVYEPSIKIVDENNREVKYSIKDNKIIIEDKFTNVENLDDAKKYIKNNFDILKFAENWSLFLTDDLSGSYHGFYNLTPYLINGSLMYERAYGYSHNIDITFVSNHRLKYPTFTNEEVKNFIIYNDLAFSCEVYLEKNMIVSGKDKVDVMHERLYFIYYNNGYKLVNMEPITE